MVSSQIIEKHKAAVEINTFQDVIGNNGLHKSKHIFFLLEIVVQAADKSISFQKMCIIPPLIQNLRAFLMFTDRIQHIAVALAVHSLLKSLDGQTQIHLIGCDIFTDSRQIGCLDAVQKDKEGEDLVIGPPLFL